MIAKVHRSGLSGAWPQAMPRMIFEWERNSSVSPFTHVCYLLKAVRDTPERQRLSRSVVLKHVVSHTYMYSTLYICNFLLVPPLALCNHNIGRLTLLSPTGWTKFRALTRSQSRPNLGNEDEIRINGNTRNGNGCIPASSVGRMRQNFCWRRQLHFLARILAVAASLSPPTHWGGSRSDVSLMLLVYQLAGTILVQASHS